ncbi:regulator of cell cycle RGCC-like [Arapaima gigas]
MSAENIDVETELGDVMQEFHDVMEDLMAPSLSTSRRYEQHLTQAKSKSQATRGAAHPNAEESEQQSLGSSSESGPNDTSPAGVTTMSKAKLGDTDDLQSFIDNLDAVLAEI